MKFNELANSWSMHSPISVVTLHYSQNFQQLFSFRKLQAFTFFIQAAETLSFS